MESSTIDKPQLPESWLNIKVIGLLTSLIVLSGGVGWWLLSNSTSRQPIPKAIATSPTIKVQTAVIKPMPVRGDRTLTGTVEAVESVTLTSRVMGQIERLPVQEGDLVKAGQLIARIDVRDIQAQRNQGNAAISQARSAVSAAQSAYLTAQAQKNQAEARVREAQATLTEAQAELADAKLHQKRMAMLRTEGVVSQSQLDEANTRVATIEARIGQIQAAIKQAIATVDQAQAQVRQAQAQIEQSQAGVAQAQATVEQTLANLDYGTVTAPFTGVVTRKHAEVGAMAGTGQALVTLENIDRLRFSVAVPESLIGRLEHGQPVQIELDALNRSANGRVSQIIPAADPASRNFTVKIALASDADIIPGMFGRLQLTTSTRQALMIPNDAIVKRMGITGAYKVVDGKAQFQTLTAGTTHGEQVEVYWGLEAGDRVILNPSPALTDGALVSLQ
ncbi:RND family efflux transporter, MFP subunit [Pleurocapsa sp. PCC 7327]|uniref:efflux RND transporter periplasmic adaptor subunit n=1 Tax=Pleurocapsa sp. PCC 7327 TaxID=118163 RepID=UPI00029FEFED|nr:efflux RND transporter periplasmic adaptor subunit [Pleurocapsa sp. PCC 7327]AFY78146.1 RND family efflux transporter, MFP subunit [Pleurocapsa sp. PCC 7327]